MCLGIRKKSYDLAQDGDNDFLGCTPTPQNLDSDACLHKPYADARCLPQVPLHMTARFPNTCLSQARTEQVRVCKRGHAHVPTLRSRTVVGGVQMNQVLLDLHECGQPGDPCSSTWVTRGQISDATAQPAARLAARA